MAANLVDPGDWKQIEDADLVALSAASIWELEIKRVAGRLRAPADLAERAVEAGFEPLPISLLHARAAAALPSIHADPFDRMLVAQARAEQMTLATADTLLGRYDVNVLLTSRRS